MTEVEKLARAIELTPIEEWDLPLPVFDTADEQAAFMCGANMAIGFATRTLRDVAPSVQITVDASRFSSSDIDEIVRMSFDRLRRQGRL